MKHEDPSTPGRRLRSSPFFQVIGTRIAAWAERRQAENQAFVPVEETNGRECLAFAEKFRYTIATSYLLAPTLSISKYERGETKEDEFVPFPKRVYPLHLPDAKYRVQTRIAGQLPMGYITAATLLLGWAVYVQVPVALMLLVLIFFDACTLVLPVSEMLQCPPQYISFSVSTPPSARESHGLTSTKSIQLADEQAYLRAGLLRGAMDFIDAAQAMDHALNDALSAVQEVELVSRRFSLSTPLPPISRIEASWSFDEHGHRHGVFPQRMTSMRKTIADALEEVCFHCRAVCERFEASAEEEESERVRELMMLRQHSVPNDWDGSTSSAPLSPRPLSLAAWASPARVTPTPDRGRKTRYPQSFLTPGSSPMPSQRRFADDSVSTSYERARKDRLSLVSLRSQFEAMHMERQTILYHLLSLNMDMSSKKQRAGTAIDARVYWDDDIIQGVLKHMTSYFRLCEKQVRAHVQNEMSMQRPGKKRGHGALDLDQHLCKMGQLLRTLQCKMKVCREEGSASVPWLHGIPSPKANGRTESVLTMFESMKDELLSLSSEWEAGMRMLDPPSSPSVPETPLPYEPVPTTPPLPSQVPFPSEDTQDTEFRSGTNHSEMLSDTLIASSSPTSLPPPGSEEVFECDTRALTPRTPSTLSRAERIARRKQEREVRRADTDDVHPLAMVSELKSVLQRRTHSLPVH